jgi:5'(3')-deoxyribonucleotidase
MSIVGVDVDGVLGDQVTPLLLRIEERLGIKMTFEDIAEWNPVIGESDFKTEIAAAMDDPTYVAEMPLHAGAREMMDGLVAAGHTILVITTRKQELLEPTAAWLREHSLPYSRVISAEGIQKALHGASVLIDDYTENVKHFLEAEAGWGVLVDRPWNQERDSLRLWIGKRAIVATDLRLIPDLVQTFESA